MAIAPGPRVLLADDHSPTRAALRNAVEKEGFVVCAEVPDADTAIEAARQSQPDAAVLDIRMPGNGIRAAEVIGTELPHIAIVMLTVSDDDLDMQSAIAAGASGYVLKGQDPKSLPEALRIVLSGEAVLPGTLVKRLVNEFRTRGFRERLEKRLPDGVRLTSREWEVLELLSEGHNTAEIGERLYVADVTVRSHLAAIIRKLQVDNRADAVRLVRALRAKLDAPRRQ